AGVVLPRPLATLLVNIIGAFLLAAFVDSQSGSDVAVGVGGIGALTTFSTVVDDLGELWAIRRSRAVAYGVATIVLGVGAAWLGLQIS
ncbi:MAG: fluoride efflux transporter FluC, partial [Acidimicrobiales bacterium]